MGLSRWFIAWLSGFTSCELSVTGSLMASKTGDLHWAPLFSLSTHYVLAPIGTMTSNEKRRERSTMETDIFHNQISSQNANHASYLYPSTVIVHSPVHFNSEVAYPHCLPLLAAVPPVQVPSCPSIPCRAASSLQIDPDAVAGCFNPGAACALG